MKIISIKKHVSKILGIFKYTTEYTYDVILEIDGKQWETMIEIPVSALTPKTQVSLEQFVKNILIATIEKSKLNNSIDTMLKNMEGKEI